MAQPIWGTETDPDEPQSGDQAFKLYVGLAALEWDYTQCKYETIQTAGGPFPGEGVPCGPALPFLPSTLQPVFVSHSAGDNWGIGEHVVRSADLELRYEITELQVQSGPYVMPNNTMGAAFLPPES